MLAPSAISLASSSEKPIHLWQMGVGTRCLQRVGKQMRLCRLTCGHPVDSRHELPLAELVDWAGRAMYEGEFNDEHFDAIRDAVAELGLADVKAFGLTWEDCESLLKQLGYSVRVDVVSV